jgi:hypothetical protein
MDASGQFHVPAALTLEKESPVSIQQEDGWAQSQAKYCYRDKNPCICQESKPGHPIWSQSLYWQDYPASPERSFT